MFINKFKKSDFEKLKKTQKQNIFQLEDLIKIYENSKQIAQKMKILCFATVNWQVSINGLTGAVHIDESGRRQNYSIGVYRVGFKENPRKVSMASLILQPKQCCDNQ